MSQSGPINMEDDGSDIPTNVSGRVVDPDTDERGTTKGNATPMDMHMAQVLEHIDPSMKERVSKLGREELSMPGAPKDREAYEAYLTAEKILRDLRRKQEKKDFNWNGLPKENG
jgi:hypothetical protein